MMSAGSLRSWRFLAAAELLLWRRGWWGPLVATLLLAAAALWQWELRPTASRIERFEAALRSRQLSSATVPTRNAWPRFGMC
jgi:hypothetical protein